MMSRSRWQYALVFLSFLALALAASPTTFCKCSCFSNSTIIPLDSRLNGDDSSEDGGNQASSSPSKHRTCNDCNKQFCLDYNLPICQGATEADVVTTCFQRDSTKDQLVVFIFLFATGGLLTWAAVRPWWERWRTRSTTLSGNTGYAPVIEQ